MSRHANQLTHGRGPHQPAVDLVELRVRLTAMTFREAKGSGTYTPNFCPVCREDRHGEEWVGRKGDPDRMCERCFSKGREYPRISNRMEGEEGRTMPPETLSKTPPGLRTCPECGRTFKPTGLGPHKAQMHGHRPSRRRW